jgi:hypothetical protein
MLQSLFDFLSRGPKLLCMAVLAFGFGEGFRGRGLRWIDGNVHFFDAAEIRGQVFLETAG